MTQVSVRGESNDGATSLPSETYVGKTMPSILGTFDLTATYIVAIFFIENAATAASGDAAAFTYLLLGAVAFFVPCAITTAQLGHMFPYEGSLYNWTHKALGGYWSFFSGFCSWFPGVLVMVAGSDVVVTLIQGLHSDWLTEPWQQGLVIVAILVFSGVLAVQRLKIVQVVVNSVVVLIFLAVVLIGASGAVWLLTKHAIATNLLDFSRWNINWDRTHGNINLFGLITLAYLGTEVPLSMGGEIRKQNNVTSHIWWGTVLVLFGYFVTTAALLIVQGSAAVGNLGGFAVIKNVDIVLGPVAGKVTAVCVMAFFVIVPVVYNYAFARLLLVGGIDQRLPMSIGKLNRNRVPANAIWFQTIIAIIFTIVAFVVIPYVFSLSKPGDLAIQVYNVSQAAVTLVWAIAIIFLFVNIALLYFRDPVGFRRQRIVPQWTLVLSVIIGPIACVAAIIDTLFFSWIPQIDNSQWWYIVGGLTVVCLIIAVIGSMFATSEASWQVLEKEGEPSL
jgi:amino acid transporter